MQVPPLVKKRDWFVIDYQQIKNTEYITSLSQPTKSARLASYSEFIVDPDLPKVLTKSHEV